jgi:hypothetical protein
MLNPIQPIYVPTPWFSPLPFDEEFAQRKAFIHGLLFGNVINPVALGLDRAETTAKSWAKLKATFGKTTSLGLADAQRKLRTTFYDGTSHIEEHVKSMCMLWASVNEHGGSIDDIMFMELFITLLPHSWDNLLPILNTLTRSIAVIAYCNHHYTRKNASKEDVSSPSTRVQVLVVKPNLYCTNYLKPGHLIQNLLLSWWWETW